jgi:hypothetical protein
MMMKEREEEDEIIRRNRVQDLGRQRRGCRERMSPCR